MATREEHLAWCKERALEYLARNDVPNAIASMMSDLQKHEETRMLLGGILSALGLQAAMANDPAAARRYIEGFN